MALQFGDSEVPCTGCVLVILILGSRGGGLELLYTTGYSFTMRNPILCDLEPQNAWGPQARQRETSLDVALRTLHYSYSNSLQPRELRLCKEGVQKGPKWIIGGLAHWIQCSELNLFHGERGGLRQHGEGNLT